MKTYIIPLLFIFLFSCNNIFDNPLLIQVDMSKEHDAGYFKPENGDRISLAGNFNQWKKDSLFLEDEDGDWIYSVTLWNIAKKIDTLVFKFKCLSGDGRLLADSGWEGVPDRKISVNLLKENPPVFIFSEFFDYKELVDLTFTVGTSNQQILGFFQPEKGDHIVVSGSFCNWNEEGILMFDDDKDKIYSVTLPARVKLNEPIIYKFKIIPNRNTILPDQGWEALRHREFIPSKDNLSAPYAEFSDLRRVARFIINTKEFINQDQFKPLKGDVLQLKLLLDKKESLSNPLTQINPEIWEISLTIPMTVRQLKWQLLNNMQTELTAISLIEVPFSGKIIKFGFDE